MKAEKAGGGERPLRKVTVLGVPMDLGAGRRGVDMGPSAIRYAGLEGSIRRLGHRVEDRGDLPVDHAGRAKHGGNPRLHFLDEVIRVNAGLAEEVRGILAAGGFPVILGGDHSIAIGILSGLARSLATVGVLWFDAHGDFNTDATTPSGNIHGMPLAVAVGRGSPDLLRTWGGAPFLKERDLSLIGVRELDPAEREALRNSEVHVATMTDIDRQGMRQVVEASLGDLAHVDHLHVSFDMDVMDPREAPGVGTPHAGGITYREAHLAMEMIAASGRLASMSIVEVNPILDNHNVTGHLAAELAASALGQVIL